MRVSTLSLAVILLAASASRGLSDSAPLKWKLKAGTTFYVENTQKLNQVITVMGREIKQNVTQVMLASFAVKKVTSDGGAVIEQTFLKISSKGNLPGAGNNPIQKKMEGAKFTITLNGRHQVTKFEGYDEFVKKAADGNAVVERTLRSMMTKETLQKTANESFSQLPGKSVPQGHTWKRADKLSLGPIGDMAMNVVYKYTGNATVNRRKLERITFDVAMKYSPPKGGAGGLPFKITKGSLKSDNSSGIMYFDPVAGRVVSTTIKTKLSGDLTIQVAGNTAQMGLKQEMTIESRVLDKNPLIK